MKIISSFFVLFTFLFIIACNNAPKSSADGRHEPNTITRAEFLEWTARWDTMGVKYSDTTSQLVQYYKFPVLDMREFLDDYPTIDTAFFYQGLKMVGKDTFEARLILTSTNNKDTEATYYDVSRPCPRFCGEVSSKTK